MTDTGTKYRSVVLSLVAFLCCAAAAAAQQAPYSGDVRALPDDPGRPLFDVMRADASRLISAEGERCVWTGYCVQARESLQDAHFGAYCSTADRTIKVGDGIYYHSGSGDGSGDNISINGICWITGDDGAKIVGSVQKAVLYRFERSGLVDVRVLEMYEGYEFRVPLLWIDSVDQSRSLACLSGVIENSRDSIAEDALPAAALHEGPEPKRIMENLIHTRRSTDLREDALFWFGHLIDEGDFDKLVRLEDSLNHPDLREQLTFVYHQIGGDRAIDRLLWMARHDSNEDVREQAIFWLGQMAGRRAIAELADVVENDPDTEMKKHAVFALSHMDDPEAFDQLVRIARTHSNPSVRKSAIFWIAQCEDERALEFLEEILNR